MSNQQWPFNRIMVRELITGFVSLSEFLKNFPLAATPHDRSEEIANVLKAVTGNDLHTLPSSGLAHDHVRIANTDFLLRIPKQSQMRLSASENLLYQANCFHRMHPSGHTPQCFGAVKPCKNLPMGCLVVQYIDGRALHLPDEINHAALALAAIHSLDLPEANKRLPLLNQSEPLAATLAEVQAQSEQLEHAYCSADSKHAIRHQLTLAKQDVARLPEANVSLISFDAHPGNFLIDSTGKAFLVDLEKGRYGGAGFDLAHATLYTSTTWDPISVCTLTQSEVSDFYKIWHNAMPANLASALEPQLHLMRRLMWLWSLTWCAKWTVESKGGMKHEKEIAQNAEDWSAENSDDSLIQHVQERVNHYLDMDTISMIAQEFTELT